MGKRLTAALTIWLAALEPLFQVPEDRLENAAVKPYAGAPHKLHHQDGMVGHLAMLSPALASSRDPSRSSPRTLLVTLSGLGSGAPVQQIVPAEKRFHAA